MFCSNFYLKHRNYDPPMNYKRSLKVFFWIKMSYFSSCINIFQSKFLKLLFKKFFVQTFILMVLILVVVKNYKHCTKYMVNKTMSLHQMFVRLFICHRCMYNTLAGLRAGFAVGVSGVSGVGKSVTTQELARLYAKPLFNFDCAEQSSIQIINK